MCSPDSMCAVHSLMRANSDFILNPHVAIPKGKETTGCMGALGSQHLTFLTVHSLWFLDQWVLGLCH